MQAVAARLSQLHAPEQQLDSGATAALELLHLVNEKGRELALVQHLRQYSLHMWNKVCYQWRSKNTSLWQSCQTFAVAIPETALG